MLGLLVDFQSVGLEELLGTEITLKWETTLVTLHMIVHRVLSLFRHVTVGTYIVAIRVLLIGIRHLLYEFGSAAGRFNFFYKREVEND